MYYKFFLFLIFIFSLFANPIRAQVRYENDTVYKFSSSILRKLDQDSVPDYFKAAQDFSFIGDYLNALTYGGKGRSPYGQLSKEDSLYFAKFYPVNAREYILKRAQREQIIMINEAHHYPYHRIFITTLLERLHKVGFRYYGVETLNYMDSTLNERGYPSINTGYYTVEPQFGNLIREALNLGFHVFAYEARSVESFTDPKKRELEQARHIQQILQIDPKAKILIHAGYDHIREDSVGGDWGKAMAGRVKELTGIDPFTINQEVLTERIDPLLENPYYSLVEIDSPTIFMNDKGEIFSGPKGTHYFDVRVAHPRTRYVNGRPDWLIYGKKQYVHLNKDQLNIGCPCLIQVYKVHEDFNHAVPVDVIEVPNIQELNPLALVPGEYQVLIKSENKKSKMINLLVE